MNDRLVEMKGQLSRAFLGKAGIHGFGISRSRRAIQVYVTPSQEKEQQAVLKELKQAASPFDVVLVMEEPPRLS
jgi:hypothetical protein